MKKCTKCLTEKELTEFYPRKDRGLNSVRSTCKECCNVQLSKIKKPKYIEMSATQKDKRKESYRKHRLKKHYGLSVEQYDNMFSEQNGRCAVCGSNQVGGKHKDSAFYVDHSHETGNVRGLLCSRCNLVLGLVDDDIDLLGKMSSYLTHTTTAP